MSESLNQLSASTHTEMSEDGLLNEMAELHKQDFIQLVRKLAELRDLQYTKELSKDIVRHAEGLIARNLPRNLIRAAAILVDWRHGVPSNGNVFAHPAWMTAKELLPEAERGHLACSGFKELSSLTVGDTVVLTSDIESESLHAGMAGMVKEPPSDEDEEQEYLVQFGENEDILVPAKCLRTPRPGSSPG